MTGSTLATYLSALINETPEFRDGARVLDHADALSAVLDEIDRAVLPAVLTFENDAASVSLLVTGRRLHCVVSGGGAGVDGKPLSPDDAEQTKATAQALADFANGSKALRMRSAAPDPDAADMSDRVSVRVLQAALGMVIDDPDAPPLDRFMAQMGDAVTAAVYLEDRVVTQTSGASIYLAGLKIAVSTQLSAFLDARHEKCASHSEPSLTFFTDVVDVGISLGLVTFETHTALFTCATTALPRASNAFRKVT